MPFFAGRTAGPFVPLVLATFSFLPTITPAVAADAPLIPAKLDLQDGDTFVFLGDSITHQRLYTQYFETFFYTRLPARRIRFHNAGVGGAQAWDALQRMQEDVTDFKPNYVSILLGMNDGRYQPFNREIFDTYKSDMTEIAKQIRAAGAAPIFMSPTMFDSRAASLRKNAQPPERLEEYNSLLAYYGRWLQHQAIESGSAYVDMFGPLNRISLNRRRKDANFTLIKDAVHPDAPGQVVMALAMIDQLGAGKPLSSIVIRTGGRKGPTARVTGGALTNLSYENGQVEFDWTADGLPWVLPENAQPGMKLTNADRRVSRETIRIVGLKPAKYEVVIDDTVVATTGADQLSQPMQLQRNKKTPQYQQALQVALLNETKNSKPVGRLRGAWSRFQRYARLKRDLTTNPDNEDLQKQMLKQEELMEDFEDRVAAAQEQIADFENRIYAANQPVTRHYVIRKVTK